MAKRDYYETLGVSRRASAAELKAAYRKLALQCHPDRNPGDRTAEARFKEVNEAYEVLKDEQKRAAYDQFGHAAFEGGMGPGGRAGNFDFGSFADVFDDLFGDFMGGGRRRGAQSRGADLRYNLEITLEEAFSGKQAQIRVPTTVRCETCDASGSGRVHREKTLSVTIPQGVEDGTRIRLTGEGEAGTRGGATGDLYIFVSVTPHRMFKRDGSNLYCRVPIPVTTAALGGQIEVPTIDGRRARLQIPEGTQSGHRFRLRGRGMTELHGHARGDMF